jgi:hypothetical protein
MIWMSGLLFLIAQATHPRAATNQSVVKEEFEESDKGNSKVKGEIKLPI